MTADGREQRRTDRRTAPPDLQTQLEALLHEVWTAEARWRLEDRIDLAVRHCQEG